MFRATVFRRKFCQIPRGSSQHSAAQCTAKPSKFQDLP